MQSISTNWHPSSCFSGCGSVLRCSSIIKLSQFLRPLTSVFLVSTLNFQIIERLFQTFVWEIRKLLFIASWARLFNCFDVFNTSFAKLLSTACDLVGLSNDLETNRTLCLENIRWRLQELTIKSNYSSHCSYIVLRVCAPQSSLQNRHAAPPFPYTAR